VRAVAWIVGIVAGIVVVLLITLAIGRHNDKNKTVAAGDWANTVCANIATWRGEMESIVDDVTQAPAVGSLGVEEPQSQTTGGRTELIRDSLTSAVRATSTMVVGIDDAGTPNTAHGKEAASQVSDWAHSAKTDLEQAETALHTQATTLEDAVRKVTGAASAITTSLTTGVRTIASVARLDRELAAAFKNTSTCQGLSQEETSL
jgi:hypothetical protein